MKTPHEILRSIWGHQNFRGSQLKVINTLISGKDVLALMPTGGGKSLCFQIPALSMEGICIVVSPLVALIQNQVDSLKKKGIKALAITGGISFEELSQRLDNCVYGGYKFLYLSPERLQQRVVKERISQMNVNLIAIDEAHCISQWGNDFRPSYLHCAVLREIVPEAPMIALTATATKKVSEDIAHNLLLEEALQVRDSFARKNLAFEVKRVEDKQYQLHTTLQSNPGSAIVYVGTRKKTQALSQFLEQKRLSADFFHGGLSQEEKKTKLNNWLSEKTQIMVATNAFGMGIDKSNVRTVVHYRIPDSLENYFQEAGRAGRDGELSTVLLLTNEDDKIQARKQYLDMFPDLAFLKNLYKNLNNHFQIAYGEIYETSFDFDFNSFCSKYKLNSHLTLNGLKLLDQHSIIALSEAFRRKSSLKFLGSKERLFQYMEHNSALKPFIQSLLRTYGGLFDFETKVNIQLIQRKTEFTEKELLKALNQLKTDGIIDHSINQTDLTITFLVPREDEKTLNSVSHKIKDLYNQKRLRFEKMLEYAQNELQCRMAFLLHYFGEEGINDCGLCDVCKNRNGSQSDALTVVKNRLLEHTKVEPRSSRELASLLNIDETQLLPALKELLEDELLTLTQTNAYKSK